MSVINSDNILETLESNIHFMKTLKLFMWIFLRYLLEPNLNRSISICFISMFISCFCPARPLRMLRISAYSCHCDNFFKVPPVNSHHTCNPASLWIPQLGIFDFKIIFISKLIFSDFVDWLIRLLVYHTLEIIQSQIFFLL